MKRKKEAKKSIALSILTLTCLTLAVSAITVLSIKPCEGDDRTVIIPPVQVFNPNADNASNLLFIDFTDNEVEHSLPNEAPLNQYNVVSLLEDFSNRFFLLAELEQNYITGAKLTCIGGVGGLLLNPVQVWPQNPNVFHCSFVSFSFTHIQVFGSPIYQHIDRPENPYVAYPGNYYVYPGSLPVELIDITYNGFLNERPDLMYQYKTSSPSYQFSIGSNRGFIIHRIYLWTV